jgi:PIN domain nuclease of toxin-antitoxin system
VKLLLDTHALLWWLDDDRRLGAQARALIEAPDNTILVSVVTLWEMVVKIRIGKLQVDITAVEQQLSINGFHRLAITPAHLQALVALPLHHRDPFDHLLIAQAISEEAIFVSDDGNAAFYPVKLLDSISA